MVTRPDRRAIFPSARRSWAACLVAGGLGVAALAAPNVPTNPAATASPASPSSSPPPPAAPAGSPHGLPAALVSTFGDRVQPLVRQLCVDCHSADVHKGSLDLERFATVASVRKDLKVWQTAAELLEAGEMPPKDKPQPTPDERRQLVGWIRGLLDAEARARAGDPGFVPLRRLSNAEYDNTVRDLTGVDLRPAKEFPADGAAGEGFTNAAEALTDVSPTLLNKYLLSAKEIAAHAVLLPDGFRFSPAKTRRDWSDEIVADLRAFYARYATPEGKVPLQPYLAATIRERNALLAKRTTPEDLAERASLNPKYLRAVWRALTDETPSLPLDGLRARWRGAKEADAAALAADVAAWQGRLWNVVPIGSYRFGDSPRQVANDAPVAGSQTLRLAGASPAAGGSDVVFYLAARELSAIGPQSKSNEAKPASGGVVWGRPRLEGPNQPGLLLRDYAKFGPAYEVDYALAYADAAKYLAAVATVAKKDGALVADVARASELDTARLQRWVDLLGLPPGGKPSNGLINVLRETAAAPLTLLTEKKAKVDGRDAINGWHAAGADLPVVLSNASDVEDHIPGRAGPHAVVVHPMPAEFVAVTWTSPVDGAVTVAGRVAHAHPACGNGVAWWLERHRGDRAGVLAEGAVDLGKAFELPMISTVVAKGDKLVLAIDARDQSHVCDLTEINLTVTEGGGRGSAASATTTDQPGKAARTWDLSRDVADHLLDGNPHADRFGNAGVWSFVKGPSRPVAAGGPAVPDGSVLAGWRAAATDPNRSTDAGKLADRMQALLTGPRPAKERTADRLLYDRLASADGPILRGLDVSFARRPRPAGQAYGLDADRFGPGPAGATVDAASVFAPTDSVVEVRLPAALLKGREFVVDARLATPDPDWAATVSLTAVPPGPLIIGGASAAVATPGGSAHKKLLGGLDAFRQAFPLYTCFPGVIPLDEVVCLKMYHREDEPLERLFLDDADRRRLDRLWVEHRFVTQQPLAESRYLPQFIGFVTQDQPKELLAYFESQRPTFRKRADQFEADWEAAALRQLVELAAFSAKAFRRPLSDKERADQSALYRGLRDKGVSHEDAFRGVLARVLVSPSFLFRVEQSPRGKEAGPVDDWELATRLSYFLWSTAPDDELRSLAAEGRLHDPDVLARQARRMLKDDRVRTLGVEFGTQMIHVRGFDQLKEKSERLFPGLDDKLRGAINEESILFFQDLFQQDRPVSRLLDADYTYLNDALATHYGIPGVSGSQWRRVDGVRRFGRGGLLGLASVQAKQAGASRTSPVLRGNWVLETLLGEKLPRPPANVPQLPEEEGTGGLTTRQMVEKHTSVASCRSCHERIDPIGFAFERYDPIGRLREKESTGQPIDCGATLKDGTRLDGIDGLRDYLLTRKREVVVGLFCRRLLGYALGRATTVSDQLLVDDLTAAVQKEDGRVSAAVLAIVRSPQFRNVRGAGYEEGEQ